MKKFEQFQDRLARIFPKEEANDKTVTFQVTDACNLSCTYCYQINKHHNVMKFETAKKFIDLLLADSNTYINTTNTSGISIEFIGGEPFLEIELIDQITDYFINEMIKLQHPWATRYMISICSNGILYFDSKVQTYLRKHLNHISFSISIDGNKELHDACRVFPDGRGSYDIAIAGVNHFVNELHGSMGSKMTIAPDNVFYVYNAVKNLIELGYEEINLNCVYEEGWTSEHATILYNQLKQVADYLIENDLDIYLSIFSEIDFCPKAPEDNDNWCGADARMIAVDWRGDIYPCIRFMESSLGDDQEPYKIGNVNTGIMATEEEIQRVQCLECLTRHSQSTDECFNCPIANGCSWCTGLNYQLFGTPNARATYICIMHKARALANAYYWNKYFRSHNENKRFKIYIPDDWALEIISEDELNILKELEK